MEPHLRCRRRPDQYPEVSSKETRHPELLEELHCSVFFRTNSAGSHFSLLNDPNTGSPANVEASNLYKDNRKEYTKRVRETVEKSWED